MAEEDYYTNNIITLLKCENIPVEQLRMVYEYLFKLCVDREETKTT